MISNVSQYEEYYGDARLSAWRELSALDKAANVIAMWRRACPTIEPRVVDIGCGDGAVIQEFGRLGFGSSFVGYEISSSGIAYARKRIYSQPAQFEVFDGCCLPNNNKSFDLAILSHVLEHVESPRLLLREASRVARYVFVEVPLELNARTPKNFCCTDVGHINLYNPLLIRHLVQSVGLRILAERVTCPRRAVFTFQCPGLVGMLHWAFKSGLLKITPVLAPRWWTYHGCLIARAE